MSDEIAATNMDEPQDEASAANANNSSSSDNEVANSEQAAAANDAPADDDADAADDSSDDPDWSDDITDYEYTNDEVDEFEDAIIGDGGSAAAAMLFVIGGRSRAVGDPGSTHAMPVVPSELNSMMTDALSATNGQATAESVESLRQIVAQYEETFKQFKQETESAIATFRQQFSDIRRKFETLKRIRQSLVMEMVQPRTSSRSLAAVNMVRQVVGSVSGAAGAGPAAGDGAAVPAASSGVRRKRWGKRTSFRWRSDHSGTGGGGGHSSRF